MKRKEVPLVFIETIRGSRPRRYRVVLVIGVQAFNVNGQFDYTLGEARWLRLQLQKALQNI